MEHGWLITPDASYPARPGQATLALAFQISAGRPPLMAHPCLATVKDAFEKASAAKTGPAPPPNKLTLGELSKSGVAEGRAGIADS